jgi:hypothetical protein
LRYLLKAPRHTRHHAPNKNQFQLSAPTQRILNSLEIKLR